MTESEARLAGAEAAEALEPEAGLLALIDPLALGNLWLKVAVGLARHPLDAALAVTRFATGLAAAGAATAARVLGGDAAGPAAADGDRRFADVAWRDNPGYFALRQVYLLSSRLADELVEAAALPEREARKAGFATRLLVDALAPTNTLPGNPAALRRAFDTGGASLARGLRNFLADLGGNDAMPRQVDTSPFVLGENIAATPGKVVYRNALMELIQYAPQTETVHEIPLLLSPPWINKYYIMDLAPGRSFAEWAVTHGHTVFAISYRNPDESLREISLDDYLRLGPYAALDVTRDVTGSQQANVVGLCLGGTLAGILLCHQAAHGERRVRSATLLNTLLDFDEPGPLAAFTDPRTVARLERKMRRRGLLEGSDMARTFNLLRANDLIWNYVGSNWLMGEDPPAFDILAWNADSTRMPAKMHSAYLRSCYLRNELARGELELDGTRLDPGVVDVDLYVLGAEEDHIAPWRSCYRTTQLVPGPTRFVLTSSGHVAGIANPPSPKRRYWASDEAPADPDAWRLGASERGGSWWEDWTTWIGERAGERRDPPPLGGESHPVLADAPGTYVLQR